MQTIGFLPWWPSNPYQVQLKQQLNALGFRVIGNPPLGLLRILLKRDGLDVVHIHWPHGIYANWLQFFHTLAVLLLYRLLRNNIVWTVHELDAYESAHPRVDAWFRRVLMRLCRGLIVHGEHTRDQIRRQFGYTREIVVVRHPSYAGCYPDTSDRTAARTALGIDDAARVFLYFGYIKPYKGVEDLIAAFSGVKDAKAVLLIVGKPLNEEIRSRVEELCATDSRIRSTLGFVADADIQHYFHAADIVVFPFRHTQTSGSLMLALTFGRPVIAPRIATLPEYIDETCGILFEPESETGLKSALGQAETAPLARMAEAASSFGTRHSWADMARLHAGLYALVGRPS